jgi:phosphate uptake regulator
MQSDSEILDNHIRLLAEKIIDLGVYVEESFKNAISLLFTRDWSNVYTMFQSEPDIAPVTLAGEAVQLMGRWMPTGERLHALVTLQHSATEFDAMLKIIARIADNAHKIECDIETFFPMIGPAGHQAFFQLVNSAYVQLRGCIVALSTRQASLAANVIAQDTVLDQSYLHLDAALRAAVTQDLTLTMHIARISTIVGDIEQVGNHVTRICQPIAGGMQGQPPQIFDQSDPSFAVAG